MTYEKDPVRWTNSLMDAPDVLRAPLSAAREEGPSDLQMKALALKLAALSAGTAAAASASTAHASTTVGGAAASAGTFSLAKVVVSVALLGVSATGVVVWQSKRPVETRSARVGAPMVAQPAAGQPVPQVTSGAPVVTPMASTSAASIKTPVPSAASAPVVAPVASAATVGPEPVAQPSKLQQLAPAPAVNAASTGQRGNVGSVSAEHTVASAAPRGRNASHASSERAARQSNHASAGAAAPSKSGHSLQVSQGSGEVAEIELLRRARSVLSSRPREAFALTQQHRSRYPSGVFTQERDALAIEALMRAGEMDTARQLAERFVREYPSSAHAHRFREAMGIR